MANIKNNKNNLERLFKDLEKIARIEKYEDFFVSKLHEYMHSLFYNPTSKKCVIDLYQQKRIFDELIEMIRFWAFYSEEETQQIKKTKNKTTNLWKGRDIKKDFFTLQKIHYKLIEKLDTEVLPEDSNVLKILQRNQNAIFTYNTNTGDGKFKEKEFRLTENTNYRKIFDACYIIKGEKLTRQSIVEILGLNQLNNVTNPDIGRVFSALENGKVRKKTVTEVKITEAINKQIKIIRKRTGLNTKQLVNNGGNVILVI